MLTGFEVVKANAECLQMMIDGQVVLMRQSDGMINATRILKLSPLSQNQRKDRLKALKDKRRYFPARGTHGWKNTWINIREGKALCVEFGLEEKLRPLLNRGLNSDTDDNDTGGVNASTVDRLMFANESEGLQSPFIELVYNSRRLSIRRSDWRINCTHIANQRAGRSMVPKLIRDLPDNMYEHVRGLHKHQGTYVDFDTGIGFCNRHELGRLACQLLELRRTENERAAGVPQDHVTSSNLDNPLDEPQAVSISPRLADSYHVRSPPIATQSGSKEPLMSDVHMVADDTRTSKSEGLEEEDPFEEDDESSVDTDITQLRVPPATESSNDDDDDNDANDDDDDDNDNDEALSRQSNNDIENENNHHVEGRISYYSYADFEPRNSWLKEVKVGLHTPSKTSSRYGSLTDASRSFVFAASDG